ncbi:hypothetical protein SK803_28395 [Lentzea sp. BCCO 10_0856]|uniref:Uncharacterized protein n=1 Tax=Lentzea miocenica TaxID=3095431 RepID=A0ABU4T7L8_9PSEU|nr:hypothetical protein [Lentzea sp. BCCO 10_0856]MDX8034157.1 hypothetical protein [Lentzea sp. BCCO 10_0856]
MPEDLSLTDRQLGLRAKFLAAPTVPAPPPWRPADSHVIAVGGLLGVGFATDPGSGRDLLLVASTRGLGLFDTVTGERLARDNEPDSGWPDDNDLTCQGIGPIARRRVPMAGQEGGGLHTGAEGWSVDVASPDWPNERVLLSTGSPYTGGEHGETWWHIYHSRYSELRAAGFSPSGMTLVVATSSDVNLWTRA